MQVTYNKSEFLNVEEQSKNKYIIRYSTSEEDELITAEERTVSVDISDYSHLVSAIIGIKYSKDAELALINNYIVDSETYAYEYNTYQEWRNYAKQISKEYFNV